MSETLPLSYRVPAVDPATLAKFVAERFGLVGELSALPGERDRNFRLDLPDGSCYVVKVAHGDERPEVIELQHLCLGRMAERAPDVVMARVVTARSGATIERLAIDGHEHLVRVLTWVDGVPLATVRPKSRAALWSLGELIGRLHQAFDGFDHPAAHRDLKWDLARASWVTTHWDRIESPSRRAQAERMFSGFTEQVLPRWVGLPKSVIYGDANDYNVLVAELAEEPRRTVSVIDFGDMVHSATVADLAIAIAYAALDLDDPLTAAATVVEGYTSVRGLSELELDCLYPLIVARLVVSAVNSALQRTAAPGNEYLFVSEAPVWRLLDALAGIHPRFATYRLRAAAGNPPCPLTGRVTRWIDAHTEDFIPLIGIAEGILPPRVDLSIEKLAPDRDRKSVV